jgi:hypothetical protein
MQDTPGSENVMQSRNVEEKEIPIVESSVESEDEDISVQSIPFLQIIYSDNGLDSSYKEKESETMTEVSSTWSVIGYVWSMTLSELGIIAEGKKEMSTTNSNIKSIYDNAHDLASVKLLKPTDIDKRLFLSALFDIPRSSNPIDHRYLVPLKNLPQNIIRCVKAMEQAMTNNTVINTHGIPLNTVDEVALHHILVGIYLNHSKPLKRRSSEIEFIVKSASGLFCSLWSPHNEVMVSWYVEHKLVRLGLHRCILTISFIYLGTLQLG